jgi:hypothetical protein
VFSLSRGEKTVVLRPAGSKTKLERELRTQLNLLEDVERYGLVYGTDVPSSKSADHVVAKKTNLLSQLDSRFHDKLEVIGLGAGECGSVPGSEELERLILAAVADAHAIRFDAIKAFLQGAPEQPAVWADSKPGAYTYAATYASDVFSDSFADALWRDEAVAKALEARMRTTGAWQSLERLCLDDL